VTEPVLQRWISYPEAELLEGSRAVLGAWGRLNSPQHLAQRWNRKGPQKKSYTPTEKYKYLCVQ